MAIRYIRFPSAGVLALLVVATPACGTRKHASESRDASGVVSDLPMSDPHADRQLVSGFYAVESGAWRWTGPKFAVNLPPPAGSATRGARLVLQLVVPEPTIQHLNNITLSAKVGDTPLPPETYSKTGEYAFTRDVPSSALQSNSVHLDFWLDKFIPASAADKRELGIIVQRVELDRK